MKAVDELTDVELDNLIANYRKKEATGRPEFADLMSEWHTRKGGELDLTTTIRFLYRAASERRFVSYGEVAEANGCEWNAVRYPMNDHLWALVDFATRAGWPLLSSIIVNKDAVSTGAMEGPTLLGFATAARALGYHVVDEGEFVREHQRKSFEWGQQPLEEGVLP